MCREEYAGYPWYSDILPQFRREVEQTIVCLQLEDNDFLRAVQQGTNNNF